MKAVTKEQLAARLDGLEYGVGFPIDFRRAAEENNLVIISGASDDLVELDGAIPDERGCYDGGEFIVTENGFLVDGGPEIKVIAYWCGECDGRARLVFY